MPIGSHSRRAPSHPVVMRQQARRSRPFPGPWRFTQAKADHDFVEQELELKTNTELTRDIHRVIQELNRRSMEKSDLNP